MRTDQDNLKIQRSIEDDAKQWQESGEKTDYLLKNKRLRAVKEFQEEKQGQYFLSDLSTSFIAKSSHFQRNQRIKSFGLFLIIPLIKTAIGVYFGARELQLINDKKLIQNCKENEPCYGRIEALERLVKARRSFKSYN